MEDVVCILFICLSATVGDTVRCWQGIALAIDRLRVRVMAAMVPAKGQ